MAVGVAIQIAQARTVIAALTPATSASTTWLEVPESLAWDNEPPAQERIFRVDLGSGQPELLEPFHSGAGYFSAQFVVRLRWDSLSDYEAVAARIAEDREQIVHAMELSSNYATPAGGTTIQKVTCVGGDLSQAEGFFADALVFACQYYRTF